MQYSEGILKTLGIHLVNQNILFGPNVVLSSPHQHETEKMPKTPGSISSMDWHVPLKGEEKISSVKGFVQKVSEKDIRGKKNSEKKK